jgi:hypothetical protein
VGRGGKRAGAGAPKGNLNGFKHGRYSRQYQALLRIIATTPEAIDALREISEHNTRRKNKLRRQAERAAESSWSEWSRSNLIAGPSNTSSIKASPRLVGRIRTK